MPLPTPTTEPTAPMTLLLADASAYEPSLAVPVTFFAYIVGVFALGYLAHRMVTGQGFIAQYFLGGRGLGSWTLAFSFAATAISGGTFLGVPSLLYMHGWSVGLWICSYMMVPLVSMALYGKRINQVGRLLGSITMPDLMRDRFNSPALGLIATVAIIVFLSVNLIAQFKGGGIILQQALVPILGEASAADRSGYIIGVLAFAVTVVAYTAYGGFWGVALTDVLEGAVMLAGAVLLVPLVLSAVGGLEAATEKLTAIDPQLTHLPGGQVFLPVTLAVSMLLYWPIVSAGQPSAMVRMMSFQDTASFRRALALVAVYMTLVYCSIVITFTASRALYPDEFTGPGQSDRITPVVIDRVAPRWLAGILLAAPFAAIMSTVAAFLLIISSAIVRDLWQRMINPDLTERGARIAGYVVTTAVGSLATVLAFNPPPMLQYVILFTGAGMAAMFLSPLMMGLFWRRATAAGALASMLTGTAVHLVLWVGGVALGWRGDVVAPGSALQPYYLLGFDPAMWSIPASAVAGVVVSLWTVPPPSSVVARLFPEEPGDGATAVH